jgi:asparagine synthase (glutamine-hydrolysing)
MCGIAGVYRYQGDNAISLRGLECMVAALHHRGPDESGVYVDRHVGLGHARLSVIDLSSGPQPIHNEDKTLWVVFNGEIYNYKELRQSLQERGHRFHTATDTEVLLHLYEEHGLDLLDHLNGQYAMAIWDTRKKELFLARDPLGVRPLYYLQHKGTLVFASEIKALLQYTAAGCHLDPRALEQIFTFWTTLPGWTAYK